MQAVLLAAGFGTRLRPLTNTVPKCLVPINGQPLLSIWLEQLTQCSDIDEIYVNTHYLAETVHEFIANEWGEHPQIHCWHEPQLLGTAGTLAQHENTLLAEDVLVIHADNLSVFDLSAFINAHKQRPAHCKMTMMLFETDTPSSCGIVELDDNTVVKMHEKVSNPPGNLANGAVYIITSDVIQWIKQYQATDISTQLIPAFSGKINTWVNHGYHRDIGTPESYAQALVDCLPKINRTLP